MSTKANCPKSSGRDPIAIGSGRILATGEQSECIGRAFPRPFAVAGGAAEAFSEQLKKTGNATAEARAEDRGEAFFLGSRHSLSNSGRPLAPFHPQPLDLTRLPDELMGHYVGNDGSYALYVYPKETCGTAIILRDSSMMLRCA